MLMPLPGRRVPVLRAPRAPARAFPPAAASQRKVATTAGAGGAGGVGLSRKGSGAGDLATPLVGGGGGGGLPGGAGELGLDGRCVWACGRVGLCVCVWACVCARMDKWVQVGCRNGGSTHDILAAAPLA